jgi:WS/DGAT C-terminal domain
VIYSRCSSYLNLTDLTKRVSLVYTNVRGPLSKVSVDGQEVSSIQIAAPADGSGGVVVSIFSYANQVNICISGDKARILHPAHLGTMIVMELEQLCELRDA